MTGARTHGHTAGRKTTPEFRSWCAMKQRCEDPNAENYPRYGGSGISVCERWRRFEAFLADVGPWPGPGHSLDRIDCRGNYEPGNVRWASITQQQNNRSSNRRVTYIGRTMTVAEWAREIGISYAAMQSRLNRGWPLRLALDPDGSPFRERTLERQRQREQGRHVPDRQCPECGTTFTPKTQRSRFCETPCRKRWNKRASHARNKDAVNARRRAKCKASS